MSHLINHTHIDEPFDDFSRQTLLPKKLSQLGPGVSWFDVNHDRRDDLIVGSGRGGQPRVFLNGTDGTFKAMTEPPLNQPVTRDQTSVVGLRRTDGSSVLLAGSANYEDGLAIGAPVRQYDFQRKRIDDSLPSQRFSTGPVALGDLDADGDLDLFVGGRVVPSRYPEAASGVIFRDQNGRWELDSLNAEALANAGLISGAVWSDLNNDGWPELILACDWGPVRLFRNRAGKLEDATDQYRLQKFTGWWNGVATGDIDGDGRLDIIASNWGLNLPYRAAPDQPLEVYFHDFIGNGTVEMIETEFNPATRAVEPRRMLEPLAKAIPFLGERYQTHKAFSETTVSELLSSLRTKAQSLQVTTLASCIFFNRGDRFEKVDLPTEAQLSPAFSVNVADVNGDGHEDIFLSQNFFGTRPELPRWDAGRGLWLRGLGSGKLESVSSAECGIEIYGEQRGAAVSDFDGDGRVDLAVAQNRGVTRLFRNKSAKPGLRIRLNGPPGNPAAVGASVQLVFDHRKGPLREIQAGSGYWSQNSTVEVMGTPAPATRIIIRWPGGRVTETEVPERASEIEIDTSGRLL